MVLAGVSENSNMVGSMYVWKRGHTSVASCFSDAWVVGLVEVLRLEG